MDKYSHFMPVFIADHLEIYNWLQYILYRHAEKGTNGVWTIFVGGAEQIAKGYDSISLDQKLEELWQKHQSKSVTEV